LSEIYITLEEAAGFEGMSYKGLASRVSRHPNAYRTKNELASASGGKPRVLVSLASLSKKARQAYKQAAGIEGADVIISENANSDELPWYIDADPAEYIENYSKGYYEAVELAKVIREFLNYGDRDRTEFASTFAQHNGMSQRTLYRHSQAYLEASAWAMKMSKQDGGSYDYFKVLSLCRKPKQKNTFPSLSPEVRAFIENLWFDPSFARNNGTRDMVYDRLMKVGSAKCWDLPSYPTVARYVDYLMNVRQLKNVHYLAANGERAYRNKKLRKASQDLTSVPVMGLVQGDGHTFDLWVKFKHPNGKVTAIKPVVVAWIDTRSRVLVGDIICQTASAQVVKQSILNMVYNENGGVPEWIKIDNGKEFTSESLTGRPRKERLSLDSQAMGFFKSVGIADDFRSLPYEPWGKAVIERFFGTLVSRFEKWFMSYTGTLTGSRTSSKVKKDIPGMLERGELISMEEFCGLWRKWVDEEYHVRSHKGLEKQGDGWITPIGVFRNVERYYKPAPPRSFAATLLYHEEQRVRVYQIGIKRFGYEYRHADLDPYIDDHVNIKWDENDVTTLYVYDRLTGDKICEAHSQELLQIAPRVPQKALEDHKREQNRQLKEERRRLKELTTPLEERISGHQATSNVAGFMLADGKSGRRDKVVALPADKQYKDEMRNRKTKPIENDYYQNKAEAALAKLKELG